MGGLQFSAGIGVAYYTLSRQYKVGLAQRDGEWFHLVVADKTIQQLHALLDGEEIQLEASARRCMALKLEGAGDAVMDTKFRDEIQAFRDRVRPVRRKVSHFAYTFDRELHLSVSKHFQNLEDRVSEWFDRLQGEGVTNQQGDLLEIVCDCQRQLLQDFRNFEFVTLPTRSATPLSSKRD